MMKYIIRVTRAPDDAQADFDVEATTWSAAKVEAIRMARENPHSFDEPEPDYYYIHPMDDDEEASREEY